MSGQITGDTVSEVVGAAHALARHGLVTAYGHVSARVGDQVVITPPMDLGEVVASDLRELSLVSDRLPPGVPPEAWAHLGVYRARADVGAVVRAMPPSGFAAAAVVGSVPALHGQAAWLGAGLPVYPGALLLRSLTLAEAAAATLGRSSAVLLRGNGALAVASSPGLAMARMWLVEATCSTWLRAAASGTPQPLSLAEVEAWQAAGERLLPRLWDHLRGGEE